MFAPAGLSLLMSAFPDGRERNTALGIWGAASGPAERSACCSAAC